MSESPFFVRYEYVRCHLYVLKMFLYAVLLKQIFLYPGEVGPEV